MDLPTLMAYRSSDYGILQDLVDALFMEGAVVARQEVLALAETHDLPQDLAEIVSLLPPGTYTRQNLCNQMNSSLTGHGWGMLYGTVE